MNPSPRLPLVLVLACAFFGLGAGQSPRGVRQGPAEGLWELPGFGSDGVVLGTLGTFQGGARPLALEAALFPFPFMCPACVGGEVVGTLDDGVGVGPDYLVDGRYLGDMVSGTFELVLRQPNGTAAGSMRGRFQDPSALATGFFVGRYTLRR